MMNSISWQEVAIEKHLFASELKHLQFIIKQEWFLSSFSLFEEL